MEQLTTLSEGDTLTINLTGRDFLSPSELESLVRVEWPDGREPFFVSRYEVTNREFLDFINGRGYTASQFWKHDLKHHGQSITLAEAVRTLFLDSTGKLGPATWRNGQYADGEADHPVRGISWYEAAAYAEYRQLSLLPIEHWAHGASMEDAPHILPLSNFSGNGTTAVGGQGGMSRYGAYDMFGNVKEWCLTKTPDGKRYVRGGGCDDPNYMHSHLEAFSPSERPENVGIRCAKFRAAPPEVDVPLAADRNPISPEPPVSKEEFEEHAKAYAYDQSAPLEPKQVDEDNSRPDYRYQAVEINAAYNGERYVLHLFWPKETLPPFQTIVIFPGAGARQVDKFSDILLSSGDRWPLRFAGSGRAVCWPVYKGTLERNSDGGANKLQLTQDAMRAVDFLLQHPDVDRERLAYAGFSWGGYHGPRIVALESRFKVAALLAGGSADDNQIFAPHIYVPVLMVNGTEDQVFPVATRQRPLYDLLTGAKDTKKIVAVEGAPHTVPRDVLFQETTQWLDQLFGPVQNSGEFSPEKRIANLKARSADLIQAKQVAEGVELLEEVVTLTRKHTGDYHRDTVVAKLDLASVMEQLPDRFDETLDAYHEVHELEKVLINRGILSGDDPIVTQRRGNYAWFVGLRMLKRFQRSDVTTAEYQQAVRLCEGALAQQPPPTLVLFTLAYAHYALGDLGRSQEFLNRSLADENPWSGSWHLAAILAAKAGEQQEAKDWQLAGDDWIAKADVAQHPVFQWMQRQTDAALGAASAGQPITVVEAYDRLLANHPENAAMHFRRGIWQARAQNW